MYVTVYLWNSNLREMLLLTTEAVPQLGGVPLHEPGEDLGRRQLGLLADGQHHLPAGEGRVLPARLQQLERRNIMEVSSNILDCSPARRTHP